MDSKIKIVIADYQQLTREMLRVVLGKEKGFLVVGEASNGLDTITLVNETKPDMVILDIGIPEMSGIVAIRHIKASSSETRMLIITGQMNDDIIFKALKAGAKGLVFKNNSITDLVMAIKAIYRGEMWIERKLLSRYFEWETGSEPQEKECSTLLDKGLTSRELEVLRCLTSGCSNKEIANSLYVSEKTVKSHLNSIFKKLNVSRRLEAILFAMRQGLA